MQTACASGMDRYLPVFCLSMYVALVTFGTFSGAVWADLGIAGGAAAFAATWASLRRRPDIPLDLLVLVAAAVAMLVGLNFGAQYPAGVWRMLLQLMSIFIPLTLWFSPQVLDRLNDPRLFGAATAAAMLGAGAISIELALGGPLLHALKGRQAILEEYNRGVTYLVVFSFPLMAYLFAARRWWQLALLAGVLLLPESLTESRAARLAGVVGLVTIGLGFLSAAWTRRALTLGLFALPAFPFIVMGVFVTHHGWIVRLPHSWQHRVEIWDYMSHRIIERPWFGWGLGSSPKLPFAEPDGALYQIVTENAPHPHDVILQLWVETGLPGLVAGYAFALLTLAACIRLPPRLAPFAFGAWSATLCLCLVAYSFWSDSLFALFALTGLAFILLARQSPRRV